MNTCHICGYPIPPPNQAYGYVGPVCMGHTYQMPYYTTPLTAEDVSEFQIRQMLWDLIDDPRRPMVKARYATQAALADAIGVSQAHLSATLTGKKPIGGRILDFLGIEQVTVFRRKVG